MSSRKVLETVFGAAVGCSQREKVCRERSAIRKCLPKASSIQEHVRGTVGLWQVGLRGGPCTRDPNILVCRLPMSVPELSSVSLVVLTTVQSDLSHLPFSWLPWLISHH